MIMSEIKECIASMFLPQLISAPLISIKATTIAFKAGAALVVCQANNKNVLTQQPKH
jgi:hypothetical protein